MWHDPKIAFGGRRRVKTMQPVVMQSSGSEWSTVDLVDRRRENRLWFLCLVPDLFLIRKVNYDFHKPESKLKQFGQKFMCVCFDIRTNLGCVSQTRFKVTLNDSDGRRWFRTWTCSRIFRWSCQTLLALNEPSNARNCAKRLKISCNSRREEVKKNQE